MFFISSCLVLFDIRCARNTYYLMKNIYLKVMYLRRAVPLQKRSHQVNSAS